jgi:TetR/AcrR family transcriptional repressor of nem operon
MKYSTRDKILDAVYKLVYINGYNGTSIDMILKECSIPKGSLYHYFKSKKKMALAVLNERIAPKMYEFYDLKKAKDEHSIDVMVKAIKKVTEKDELVKFGCPLNRLNQEMSPVDEDFEREIEKIYTKMKNNIITLLQSSSVEADIDSLAEYIIATVWGSLSLSPKRSSKDRYIRTINHLVCYLNSLKK